MGKVRCWAHVAGGVEVQHDTFDLSCVVIFEHEVSLPHVPMANGGKPEEKLNEAVKTIFETEFRLP